MIDAFNAVAGPLFFAALFYSIGRAFWVAVLKPEIDGE